MKRVGRASNERVHSGGRVKSGGFDGEGQRERERERERERGRRMKQTDGLTDAGSPTNGLSANC